MKGGKAMNSPLNFTNSQCDFISIDIGQDKVLPKLAMFLGSNLPTFITDVLITSGDTGSGPDTTPLYFISDIVFDPNSPDAKLVFGIAHDDFEDDEEESEQPIYAARFSANITKAQLLVFRAMQNIDPNFAIIAYKEDYDDEVHSFLRSASTPRPVFAIAIPPTMYVDATERINEAFKSMSFGLYAHGMEEIDETGDRVPSDIRKAQSNLLHVIYALKNGNVLDGWETLNAIGDAIDVYANNPDNNTIPFEERQHLHAFIKLAQQAYYSSTPENPLSEAPRRELDIEDTGIDQEFIQLMSSNNMQENLEQIDDSQPYYAEQNSGDSFGLTDPFSGEIPEAMKPLLEHISKTSPEILELVRWDWERKSVWEQGINAHKFSDVIKALLLVVAARLNKINEFSNQKFTTFNVVKFLTTNTDVYPWEIVAMKDSLAQYNTNAFTDLLSTKQSDEGSPLSSAYLFVVLYQIKKQLTNEDWSPANMDARLTSTDLHLRELPEIRSLISLLLEDVHEPDDEDDDDDWDEWDGDDEEDDEQEDFEENRNAVQNALSTFDFTFLVHNTSLLIPTLADVAAVREQKQVGSNDWSDFRSTYISTMLTQAAGRLQRTINP
jgi:hypothetical protein